MTHYLSAELALLVQVCKSVQAFEEAVENGRCDIDWRRFGRLAVHHKLGAVAYDRLSKTRKDDIPADVIQSLREIHHACAVRSLAQEAETFEIVSLLERSGLRSLVLKGIAAGRLLYPGEHSLRFSSDIDILVAPENLAVAEDVLAASGFAPGRKGSDIPENARSALLHMVHAVTYHGPTLGSEFDVHHRVSHNPHWLRIDFDELFANSEVVEIEGGPIRTLGPTHLACYLCCHMMDHSFFILKWIDDAARALNRAARMQPDFDVTATEGLVAKPAVELAVQFIKRMYGQQSMEIDAQGCAKLARFIKDIETPRQFDTTRSFSGLFAEIGHLGSRADWGGSWSSVWHDLLILMADPRDVQQLGLGKSWLPVYALAGPVFSAGRYIERRFNG